MTFPETLPHEKRADPKSEMRLVTTIAFSSVSYAYEYEKRALARRIRSAFGTIRWRHFSDIFVHANQTFPDEFLIVLWLWLMRSKFKLFLFELTFGNRLD